MNLDDTSLFSQIDGENMLGHIDGLPDQIQAAWDLGQKLPLNQWQDIHRVIVAGMGGSAIGADLVAAFAAPLCQVPIFIHRDYALPAWAAGQQTLVVTSSHSGNTEETISSFEQASLADCRLIAITTGGELAKLSQKAGTPLWQHSYHGQPRAAVGYSAILFLAILTRLGLIPNPTKELEKTVAAMVSQQDRLKASVPAVQNPAKRMAGQLYGRWVTIFGSDVLEPVARRWKSQINEIAKSWGQFEALPEADHNTLAGTACAEEILSHSMALFLRANCYSPRMMERTILTKHALMLEGLNTDFIDASGPNRLAQQWTALHFGDYTAYYLAMAYGVDPTPVAAIEAFKQEMAKKAGTV